MEAGEAEISYSDLVLDQKIRDWVLLPILFVMLVSSILRHHMAKLIQSERKPELKALRDKQTLLRSRRLRANGERIPESSFQQRRAFLNGIFTTRAQEDAAAQEASNDSGGSAGAAGNPPQMNAMMDQSMDMMKKSMTMFIPQMAMMGWVNFFFSGFVLVKLPFPLTPKFRMMLQRGIELTSLDMTYVSSLSWFFLILFGIRGVISLLLGEGNEADDAKIVQAQMGGGGGDVAEGAAPPGGVVDYGKLFQSEKEFLTIEKHDFALVNTAEDFILSRK
eukprot:TRINITY_DN12479_c0_g1_i1.p1 TRINITY_DN12479_c0_g1~~TRINITY_DN12479_c0_g1_i1.p1  ORF type:complete len:277 (+),score=86.01 TRINITY_DN12479_c0_g1_i1:127-957(+)